MNLLPPRGERALPVLAGVLLSVAFPPAAFLLPSFVALTPLLVFIAERRPGPVGRWSATRAGLTTGIVFFGLRLVWFVVALGDRSPLAVPAYVLTVLVLAAVVGAFGWALHCVLERFGPPLPVAAAVLWTATEWVHGHLGPLSFPWLPLGVSLAPFPRIAGAADLAGVAGLSFWLAAVSGGVAVVLLRARRGRRAAAALAATLAAVVTPAAYGLARAATLELRPVATAAAVQPGVSAKIRRDTAGAVAASLDALAALTREVAGAPEGLDLVVWPEVAIPEILDVEGPVREAEKALSAAAGTPILVGGYGITRVKDRLREDPLLHNSAQLFDSAGAVGPRYDKRVLVPFVERVPFGLEAANALADPRFGSLSPGREGVLHRLPNGAIFGVLICFESVFPGLARQYRARGADFLVSMSNDAWFGRDTWYGRTTALWQHPSHVVLRAIETRVGVVRSANMGIAMFVDPVGRVHERTPLFDPAAVTGTVLTSDARTLYVRWGDWVGWASMATAALAILLAWRETLRRRE